MPAPVRRFVFVLAAPTLLALVLAGVAAAGNGGVGPPDPASPSAANIRDVYWLILGITGGIFVLVEGALILFVVRYRSRGRPREVEGPQIRGHTNLELAWTAGPVVLLAIIAGFVFYKVSGINNTSGIPPAQGATPVEQIRIEGHQYYWEFRYPDGTIAVDHLRLPYNRVVRLKIVGPMSPWPARPWHFAHTPTNVSLPRPAAEACRSRTQASYSAWGSTSTCAIIAACWMPQNSAHWPRKVPSFVARNEV